MRTNDHLYTREYHTCHMFFPPNKISQCHFEAKFLRKTNQTETNKQNKMIVIDLL